MLSSHSYPVFLSLADRHCLVAGLGSVGCRKLAGLLAADVGSVLALDLLPPEQLCSQAQELLQDRRVNFAQKSATDADVRASFLVFATTSNAAENARIAESCQKNNILCNSATTPAQGSFILPAACAAPPITACISTGGASPHLARQWRKELTAWLTPRAALARLQGYLRPHILSLGLLQSDNAALFAKLAEAPVAKVGIDNLRNWLKNELPAALHPAIDSIPADFTNFP